jgi:hypothetical protein
MPLIKMWVSLEVEAHPTHAHIELVGVVSVLMPPQGRKMIKNCKKKHSSILLRISLK